MKDTLQISFFGQVSVLWNSKTVKLQSKQATLLLAYIIENPISHSRISLSSLFWPERNETEALGLLRTLLSRIQKKVPDLLVVDRYTVSVSAALLSDSVFGNTVFENSVLSDSVWVDTVQFKRLVNVNDTESWQAALEQYRGDFLSGIDSGFSNEVLTWLDQTRENYATEYGQILKKLVEAHFTNAKADLGLTYTRIWLELDNYNEEAHRYLLQFYGMQDDFIAAKNHFSKLTQMLHTELNVVPEELTIECFDHLSLTIDTNSVTDSKSMFVDINYQNLPHRADDFVGRDKDIKALKTIFEKHSLVTLYAWGGVGKTRLAIAFAEQHQHQFKDGVLYISLTNQKYESALDYFRDALKLQSSIASDIIEDLKHFFSKRQLLLIVDNAEEYIEDLVVLNQFLAVSPLLKIVVTSRVALGLQAEYKYELQGLSLPDSETDIKLSESYTLLENRLARSGVPNNFDDEVLFQLFQLSEGMPLVLEMMATWLTVLPADGLNTIQDLYLLEHPLQDVDNRHKTIELCFEYSWSLLNPESQNLAAAASIFQSGYSFAELQAVTNATTKDIFTVTHSSFLTQSSDGGFVQHPMLKYFCQQKLKADKKLFEKSQKNYVAYYRKRVQTLRDYFVENQKVLDSDVNIDNIWDVACILTSQGSTVALAHFVSLLATYNLLKNDFVRGRDQLERLLKLRDHGTYNLPQEMMFKPVRAMIYGWLIYFNNCIGDIKKSQKLIDEYSESMRKSFLVLKTFDANVAVFFQSLLKYSVADLLTIKGEFLKSKTMLNEILERSYPEASEITSLLVPIRILQSYNQIYLGDYDGAITNLQDNIDKHNEFDLRPMCYANFGKVYLELGQFGRAKYYLVKAQEDLEAFDLKFLSYKIHFSTAQIMISEKRFAEAQALIEKTNSDFYNHPSKRNKYDYRYVQWHFLTLAKLYDAQNKKDLLLNFAKQTMFEANENKDTLGMLAALYYCARAEVDSAPTKSRQYFEYVYRSPKTLFYMRQQAALELSKLPKTTLGVTTTSFEFEDHQINSLMDEVT